MQLQRYLDRSSQALLLIAIIVLPWIMTASGVAQTGSRDSSVEPARIRRVPVLTENQKEQFESKLLEKSIGGSFQFLCVNWDGDVFLVDSVTGTGTLIGPSGFDRLNSMDIDGFGRIIAGRNDVEYIEIDPVTGLGTVIPSYSLNEPNSGSIRAMAFSATNLLYFNTAGYDGTIWQACGPDLFVAFPLAFEPSQSIQGMTFAPDGTLYGWDVWIGLVTIDPNTGVFTDVNPNDTHQNVIQTITFGPDGLLYGIKDELYLINPVVGSLTLIGSGGLDDMRGCVALPVSMESSIFGINPDCDNNGIPDTCEFALGNPIDCNGNLIHDVCDLLMFDCNSNGLVDSCEVADGLAMDCNGNMIPDSCELIDMDCNANGIPDSCDLASSSSGDCNLNNILDECDIAAGLLADCNTNGIPDECEITDYQLDDGKIKWILQFNIAADVLWCNQFIVQPGQETISSITVAWSNFAPDNRLAQLQLYDDPNNDGNPSDRVLLGEVDTNSVRGLGDQLVRVPITPTFVGNAGESFFVGVNMNSISGALILADGDFPLSRSWYVLNGGTPILRTDMDFLLRADATHPSAIPDDCLARGDHNGDGVVSVLDLLNLLTNWGECPPGPELCLSDVDQDGAVTVSDLLTLLINWG